MTAIFEKNKTVKVVTSILLIITMTLYYFIFVGATAITYAAVFIRPNIMFDAYFKDSEGKKIPEMDANTTEDTYLYLDVNVLEEGYFCGQVNIENSNFEIDTSYRDEKISSIEGNTIYLNQINNGEASEIKVKVNCKKQEEYDISNLNKETELSLKGTYVNSKAEKNIDQTDKVKLIYKSPYKNEETNTFGANIVTNKIYSINGQNKRMVQILLGSKLDGNNYPVEKNEIEITVPKETEEVQVYSRGTELTNGNNSLELENNEWEYNKENNILKISIENKIKNNEEGQNLISWRQNARDTLIVTYILPQNYNFKETLIAKSSISLYDNFVDNQTQTVIKTIKEIQTDEEKDGIINEKVSGEKSEIYKGKLYSGEDKEIITTNSIDIRYAGIQEKIALKNISNTYQKIEENNIIDEVKANVITVKSIFKKQEIENILGENGSIEVQKSSQVVTKIDKKLMKTLEEINNQEETENKRIQIDNTEIALENDELIIYNLEENVNLEYIVKDIEKQGIIKVKNHQVIKNSNINKKTLKQMNTLNIRWSINENIIDYKICLKETVTRANFKINNDVLKENEVTKGVEILALFRNDDEQYDLYNNPIINIELPQEIEDIKINQVNLLHEDGLKYVSNEVYINENRNKSVKLAFEGKQTTHKLQDDIKGTYVVVNCDVKVKDNIKNEQGEVIFKYYNDDDVEYYENGTYKSMIQYLHRKKETTTLSRIQKNITAGQTGTNPNTEDPITVTKTSSLGDGADVHERQLIKYAITISNNTDSKISNLKLTDAVPEECVFARYQTGIDFDDGYEELEDVPAFTKENITIEPKSNITYEYCVKVKKEATNIGKNIGNKAIVQNNEEQYESNIVTNKIKEGKLEIETALTTNKAEDYYSDGDNIKYIIKLKNITDNELKNVVITDELTDKLEFVGGITLVAAYTEDGEKYFGEYQESNTDENVSYDENTKKVNYNFESIKANDEVRVLLYARINDEEKLKVSKVNNMAYAQIGDDEDEYLSNVEDIVIANEAFEISKSINLTETDIMEETNFVYTITLKNTGYVTLTNVLSDELPEGVDGKTMTYERTEGQETISIKDQFNEEIYDELEHEGEYDISGEEGEDDDEDEEEETDEEIKEEEETDEEELRGTEDIETQTLIELTANLKPGATLTVNLNVQASNLNPDEEEKEIINIAKYGETESNAIRNIIHNTNTEEEPDEENPDENNPDNNDKDKKENNEKPNSNKESEKETTKAISGVAWLDSDKNGIRLTTEPTLSNIKVYLIDANTNQEIGSTQTDGNGEYKFDNVKQGQYVVKFEYDGSKYRLTDYQKQDASETTNSDAISNLQNSGNTAFAQTNTIIVSSQNITHIDIGLIKISKFDLKLDKYITNILTTTKNSTKNKNYNNVTLGKTEIRSKLINNATVTVTYNIVVTNNGEIPGYAQEIVDTLPSGMTFDEKQNSGWKLNENELKNTTLQNTEISPGEKKELKLVLTKKMNENNTGTVTNTAKITKCLSAEKTEDTNLENNTNKADVIISIGTGEKIIINTVVAIMMIAGIVAIIYIKKERR